jgi:hypothetical protein
MKITKDKWLWMPHAGHFICGNDCRFHLATKVGKYLVSTVGEYWPDQAVRRIHAEVCDNPWYLINGSLKGDNFNSAYMKKFGFEDLGYDRKYETMVFKAVKAKKCKACPYTQGDGDNLDYVGYNDSAEAYKGHLKMCDKWSNQ